MKTNLRYLKINNSIKNQMTQKNLNRESLKLFLYAKLKALIERDDICGRGRNGVGYAGGDSAEHSGSRFSKMGIRGWERRRWEDDMQFHPLYLSR